MVPLSSGRRSTAKQHSQDCTSKTGKCGGQLLPPCQSWGFGGLPGFTRLGSKAERVRAGHGGRRSCPPQGLRAEQPSSASPLDSRVSHQLPLPLHTQTSCPHMPLPLGAPVWGSASQWEGELGGQGRVGLGCEYPSRPALGPASQGKVGRAPGLADNLPSLSNPGNLQQGCPTGTRALDPHRARHTLCGSSSYPGDTHWPHNSVLWVFLSQVTCSQRGPSVLVPEEDSQVTVAPHTWVPEPLTET